jgi:hypothetical protein
MAETPLSCEAEFSMLKGVGTFHCTAIHFLRLDWNVVREPRHVQVFFRNWRVMVLPLLSNHYAQKFPGGQWETTTVAITITFPDIQIYES